MPDVGEKKPVRLGTRIRPNKQKKDLAAQEIQIEDKSGEEKVDPQPQIPVEETPIVAEGIRNFFLMIIFCNNVYKFIVEDSKVEDDVKDAWDASSDEELEDISDSVKKDSSEEPKVEVKKTAVIKR